MPTIEDALTALHTYFGFEEFREGQREVISAILEGRDTVVVMPTGGGKSLCYQLPALMKEGATVVVSPLIALMKDQVDALHARGLPATFINSSITFEEQKARINALRRGEYKLVYVAPERFRSSHFVETLRTATIALFAVDEAHCISQWGHDFRPDYLRLREAVEQIGRPQIAALTATATPHVRADIIEQLALQDPRAFVSGFDRPNLTINVVHTQKEREKIVHIKALASAHASGSGIIYTSTRKAVEQVTARLRAAGLSLVAYHAGMDEAERTRAQDDFMTGRAQMIVATNAFGMGIDKPDIRFVAHYQMPGSIEAYYQEIGRAGRDGLPSTCALFFNYADKRTQDYFIEGSYPPPETVARVYQALVATNQKRIELSTSEIAARAAVRNEMAVQSALIILEKAGHIERGAASENRASVRLRVAPQRAREMTGARDTRARQVLIGLLGGYDVNERTETELDTSELAEATGLDHTVVRRALASLVSSGVINYTPGRRTRGVLMLDERPVTSLRIRPSEIARRAALEQRKLREIISFCYADRCYRAFILDYFGDRQHATNCGKCGNCTSEAKGAPAAAGGRAEEMRNATTVPLDAATALDNFIREQTPVALDLDEELDRQSRRREARLRAESARGESAAGPDAVRLTQARPLTDEESLLVRKILACAARMQGRFGKGMLASTLRGSRARAVTQAGLDRLSTYGILDDMTQDELMIYIDALVAAGCLNVAGGAYPTVSLSALGNELMRERASVELALPQTSLSRIAATTTLKAGPAAAAAAAASARKQVNTVEETYALYRDGLSIEEIGERRGLTEITIEKHLADCIARGLDFDLSQHVDERDRALIEIAVDQLGTQQLKPLRDALPAHINYRMIRFVVADLQRAEQQGVQENA
ncbi:MAG TPA: RecQ family ATP-dependent DNA helicase [Pyrinomonadaceae bacterium]|jgi:ATP-dependent DNA helicase RecQ|nr:RecQ family ATP-dependent DNA helicase [Pyrinomonadaceae bacterium]